MTELELRQSTVAIMRGWLGGRQGSAIHREIVATYNSYLPHPRGHALTMSDAWCAGTVSAAAIRAGLTDIMPVECSCTRMIELYKSKGRWVEADDYIPAPGDLIFYDWDDTGKGDCTGQPDHVGMVEAVSGRTITVIEGNYNSMVQRRPLKVNGRYIRGFGCPDYASKTEDDDMSGEEIYIKLMDYLNTQPAPKWVQDGGELQRAMERGITDGSRPCALTTRYEAAIMALRASEGR